MHLLAMLARQFAVILLPVLFRTSFHTLYVAARDLASSWHGLGSQPVLGRRWRDRPSEWNNLSHRKTLHRLDRGGLTFARPVSLPIWPHPLSGTTLPG